MIKNRSYSLSFTKIDILPAERIPEILNPSPCQHLTISSASAAASPHPPKTASSTNIDIGELDDVTPPAAAAVSALSSSAVAAASSFSAPSTDPLLLPTHSQDAQTLSENAAKSALASHGLRVPKSKRATSPEQAATTAQAIGFPVVIKGEGIAHKSEAGAVTLNIQTPGAAAEAASNMPVDTFLVEEMLTGGVAELLIGVVKDPAHGFVLTIGAGGTFTELLGDTISLLVPAAREDIETAIQDLKIHKILTGFRGAPPAHMPSILNAIEAIQNYTLANANGLEEVEVNPLICTPTDAIAADALLRRDVNE